MPVLASGWLCWQEHAAQMVPRTVWQHSNSSCHCSHWYFAGSCQSLDKLMCINTPTDQWAADKPKEEEAVLEEQASAKPSAAFWKDLLKDGYTELHVVETAALGKGKRERRQVCPAVNMHMWACTASAINVLC